MDRYRYILRQAKQEIINEHWYIWNEHWYILNESRCWRVENGQEKLYINKWALTNSRWSLKEGNSDEVTSIYTQWSRGQSDLRVADIWCEATDGWSFNIYKIWHGAEKESDKAIISVWKLIFYWEQGKTMSIEKQLKNWGRSLLALLFLLMVTKHKRPLTNSELDTK